MWHRHGSKPDFSLNEIKRSDVRVQKEFRKTLNSFEGLTFNDVKRFDQTEKPLYPNFENNKKHLIMGGCGWGT